MVWGMYLLSQALPEGMELKKAADGISNLFFQNCVEGEAYIGKYMDIPEDLLRNPNDGTANLTIAPMGTINEMCIRDRVRPAGPRTFRRMSVLPPACWASSRQTRGESPPKVSNSHLSAWASSGAVDSSSSSRCLSACSGSSLLWAGGRR